MKMLSWKMLLGAIVFALLLGLEIGRSEEPTVDAAIKKSIEWLKAKQIKDGDDKGSWGTGEARPYPGSVGAPHPHSIGIAALVLYAMLSCDVPPEDTAIKDGFAFIETCFNQNKAAITYERAVVLLALEALADARAKKKRVKEVGRIVFLLPNEKKLAEAMVKWLEENQSPAGGWRYGPMVVSPGGFNEDVSQTQVALLGLKAAARLGLTVKKNTFLKALKFNLDQQAKDGPTVRQLIDKNKYTNKKEEGTQMFREAKARGWAYIAASKDTEESTTTGSMTTAGICSLIICKSELARQPEFTKALQEATEKGINDGLAWLDSNYTVTINPGGNDADWSYYYYLYGLERVGMLGNITLIGSHNWYLDGADIILKKQAPEGYWKAGQWWDKGPDVIDTEFALLFLKKATKPILSK